MLRIDADAVATVLWVMAAHGTTEKSLIHALGVLVNLSNHVQHDPTVFLRTDAVATILQVMATHRTNDELLLNALGVLNHLTITTEGAAAVLAEGAIATALQVMAAALRTTTTMPVVIERALLLLRSMGYSDDGRAGLLAADNGVATILKVLSAYGTTRPDCLGRGLRILDMLVDNLTEIQKSDALKVVFGTALFPKIVCDASFLESALSIADDCIPSDTGCSDAESVALESICRAIEQNPDTPAELVLVAQLEEFVDEGCALRVALKGNLTFLGNRGVRADPPTDCENLLDTLLEKLQDGAADVLLTMLSPRTHAAAQVSLVPLLHLAPKYMLLEMLRQTNSDVTVAIVALLGSAEASDRQRVAQALRGCIARLELEPPTLPELPPVTNGLHDFARFALNGEFSDITFVVDGKPLCAHRVVLAAASTSDVFKGFLANGSGSSLETRIEIEIKETTFEAFELLLHFFYTGELKGSPSELAEEDVASLTSSGDDADGTGGISVLEQLATLAERYMVVPLQLQVARLLSLSLLQPPQPPQPTSSRDPPQTTRLLNIAWRNLGMSEKFQSAGDTDTTQPNEPLLLLHPSHMLQSVAARFVLEHLEQAVTTSYYDENREGMARFLVTQLADAVAD
jgi:hypothetical protein